MQELGGLSGCQELVHPMNGDLVAGAKLVDQAEHGLAEGITHHDGLRTYGHCGVGLRQLVV